MLLFRDMGCGRSKQRSPQGSSEDNLGEKDSKKRKTKHSTSDKKENRDPSRKVSDKGTSHNIGNKSMSPAITVNGSMQQTGYNEQTSPIHMEKMDGKLSVKSAFKDKNFTPNQKNIKITHSQIEFFKMLDEKIEQGKDFGDDDSFGETKST